MVIPRFVRQALLGEDLTVYGDGTQTRCFCHVRDVVRAMCALLETPASVGEVYNVGSTEEVSILELAERVIARSSSASSVELIPYEEAFETGFEDMMRRVPDTSKLEALTGWQPTYSLDGILDEVIDDMQLRLRGDLGVRS
jgi:UDP-glucose 4-epimerase